MPNQFKLPDVGEGLTEAEITAWHVAVGDTVSLNQVLLEVETAKAVVELPSPYSGTVLELLHQAGEVVPVGSPIITIGEPSDRSSRPEPKPEPVPVPEPSPAPERREAVLVGYGVRNTAVARRPRRSPPPRPEVTARPGARPLAPPPVRKLARNLGVDLSNVTPTGRDARITRDDVTAAVAKSGPAAPVGTRLPVSGVRKHIAEAMVRSAFTAPHVTEWLNVDVTRTLKLINELRAAPATRDLRITPLTLVAKAVLIALGRYPDMNASWDDAAGEIVQHGNVNLGIAVASPRGLIVPNVPAAQDLDFIALSRALTDLVTKARANRTTVAAMRGGTFTVTNVGVFGVDGATPILNPGESGILAVGQIRTMPWNHKGRIRLRDIVTLSLSFDHRVVDGELGSRVLADIANLLERPGRAFAR